MYTLVLFVTRKKKKKHPSFYYRTDLLQKDIYDEEDASKQGVVFLRKKDC